MRRKKRISSARADLTLRHLDWSMRRSVLRRKKLKCLVRTSATTKSGRKPAIAQLLAMAAPKRSAARSSQDGRASRRCSSRHRTTQANTSRSSISPEALMACSQKVNCSPSAMAARTIGIHARGTVSRACGSRTSSRCCGSRLWGSNATERARVRRVRAAQAAVNALSASGTHWAGSRRNGKVSRNSSGWESTGCQSQPLTRLTSARLSRVTQWLRVARYTTRATAPTTHGRRSSAKRRSVLEEDSAFMLPRVTLLKQTTAVNAS